MFSRQQLPPEPIYDTSATYASLCEEMTWHMNMTPYRDEESRAAWGANAALSLAVQLTAEASGIDSPEVLEVAHNLLRDKLLDFFEELM